MIEIEGGGGRRGIQFLRCEAAGGDLERPMTRRPNGCAFREAAVGVEGSFGSKRGQRVLLAPHLIGSAAVRSREGGEETRGIDDRRPKFASFRQCDRNEGQNVADRARTTTTFFFGSLSLDRRVPSFFWRMKPPNLPSSHTALPWELLARRAFGRSAAKKVSLQMMGVFIRAATSRATGNFKYAISCFPCFYPVLGGRKEGRVERRAKSAVKSRTPLHLNVSWLIRVTPSHFLISSVISQNGVRVM